MLLLRIGPRHQTVHHHLALAAGSAEAKHQRPASGGITSLAT